MNFSNGEKLIIAMLADISKRVGGRPEIDPDFISDVISGGHYWALTWEYGSIFPDHQDEDHHVTDTVNTLDMWSFMEEGFEALSDDEKKQFAVDAAPYNKVQFIGFDGNNEGEYRSIARLLIEKMDRFTRFAGRDLNSHSPSIERYRRMYRVFEPMRQNLGMGRQLSLKSLVELIKA